MASERTILHVDLDAFYVAVEQVRDPSLIGKPVIVGGDPDGRGVAATASYEARVFGVRSGMALRTAKRLCPHAIFLRGEYREYRRVSNEFHSILREYSPIVQPMGLDEAYLDVTGCEPVVCALAGVDATDVADPEALGRLAGESIRKAVRERCLIAASVGVASGRSVAKIASDAAKPDGLLVVPFGKEAEFLEERPVRDLPGLGPKAESELARHGIRTLGQLAAMPDVQLQSLLGRSGRSLAARARGLDSAEVPGAREPAKSVSREGTYAKDIVDKQVLLATLRGFAESVGAELRRDHIRARCVTLKLRYNDFSTITRSHTMEHATFADDVLFGEVIALLEAALGKDNRPVRLIGFGTSNFTGDSVQLDLFDSRERDEEALLHGIDRLRTKYGRRVLEKGITFFDDYSSDESYDPDRRTGLSSQIGLASEEPATE
jgi:DNA polymerase-4